MIYIPAGEQGSYREMVYLGTRGTVREHSVASKASADNAWNLTECLKLGRLSAPSPSVARERWVMHWKHCEKSHRSHRGTTLPFNE